MTKSILLFAETNWLGRTRGTWFPPTTANWSDSRWMKTDFCLLRKSWWFNKLAKESEVVSISGAEQPGQPRHESRVQLRREDDYRLEDGDDEQERLRQQHDHAQPGEQSSNCCHRKAKISSRANFQKVQILSRLYFLHLLYNFFGKWINPPTVSLLLCY